MEYIVEGILIILGIALIVTIIRYPKDVWKMIIGFLLSPFRRFWDILLLILLPFWIIITFVEEKIGVNYLTKLIQRDSPGTKKKTIKRQPINFQNFKKYIVVNSTSQRIEEELMEANECCQEVNIEEFSISRTENYSIIETPRNGFYGYNFLIQWLTTNLNEQEIVGFTSNGQSKFVTVSNTEGDNDLIGRTNTGTKFWVSMYDDLDEKQFLRVNEDLKVNKALTTDSLELMIKKAYQN